MTPVGEHDVMSVNVEGETVAMVCRCGQVIHGNDEDHARERFVIHHANPEAARGLAAARAALQGKAGRGSDS